jgi:hypothetical protein
MFVFCFKKSGSHIQFSLVWEPVAQFLVRASPHSRWHPEGIRLGCPRCLWYLPNTGRIVGTLPPTNVGGELVAQGDNHTIWRVTNVLITEMLCMPTGIIKSNPTTEPHNFRTPRKGTGQVQCGVLRQDAKYPHPPIELCPAPVFLVFLHMFFGPAWFWIKTMQQGSTCSFMLQKNWVMFLFTKLYNLINPTQDSSQYSKSAPSGHTSCYRPLA